MSSLSSGLAYFIHLCMHFTVFVSVNVRVRVREVLINIPKFSLFQTGGGGVWLIQTPYLFLFTLNLTYEMYNSWRN